MWVPRWSQRSTLMCNLSCLCVCCLWFVYRDFNEAWNHKEPDCSGCNKPGKWTDTQLIGRWYITKWKWHLPNSSHFVAQPTWCRPDWNTIVKKTPECRYLMHYSVKRTFFSGPSSTWTVQNLLNNVDACMHLTQDCLPPLVDSTTGHYNSHGPHNTSLWLVFLASIH